MSRAYFYLTLHADYAEFLGGLRWKVDAIEEEDGTTFALSAEIAAFLEGIVATGAPLHFDPVLHLLHLLGRGKKAPPPWAHELREAFQAGGKSLANAGAFFGLVLAVPRVASESASRRIDLPAPVSPVSTVSPATNSRSSLSMRTMSRIERAASISRPVLR